MQTNTRLGVSLGQLLAGGGANQARQAGMLNGMQQNQIASNISLQNAQREKTIAETGLKNRQLQLSSDDGLASALLAGYGADSEEGRRDFAKFRAGQYTNPTQPLAFTDGGRELPAPSYVSSFPELQKNFSGLKQMLAIGDSNVEHLPTLTRGNQRNALTAQLTPENASRQALAISALDGADPRNITQADITRQLAAGGDLQSLGKALLLAQGKGLYNSFNGGAMNVLDGTQQLNDIGRSDARSNDALAFQRNTAGNLNNANIGLTQAKTATEQAKSANAPAGATQYSTKPLPTPALKMQQEHLDVIGSLSDLNNNLAGIRRLVEQGALKLGPIQNIVSQARNKTGLSDESSREYQTMMATLEKLRNDSLKLNKGTQTEGDAQRAWNELLVSLNDPKVAIKRLGEIEAVNGQAIKRRKGLISNLRQNYNIEPLDFSDYETPRLSTGASGSFNEGISNNAVIDYASLHDGDWSIVEVK